jgi:hypothetical protein
MTTIRQSGPPAGPIEESARNAVEPWDAEVVGTFREIFIVSSRYGPEGIYATADRARDRVNRLMGMAAYRDANCGLIVRPYILDSE